MIISITGPRSVGKSTVTKLLAKKLNLLYVSTDEIGEKTLKKEGGLDKAIKSGLILKFIKEQGYSLIKKQYKEDNFVCDLSGGSISSTKFPEASQDLRKVIKKKSIVIGLLPCKNPKDAVQFLYEREKNRSHFKHLSDEEVLKQTYEHYKKFPPIFKKFCNFIIYTRDKTPEEIVAEILFLIKK